MLSSEHSHSKPWSYDLFDIRSNTKAIYSDVGHMDSQRALLHVDGFSAFEPVSQHFAVVCVL